jgi:hypothetical protein
MRNAIFALLVFAAAADAQTIELRKVRTLVDPTGKAFGQSPYLAAALPGGRYVVQETNVVPVLIDSTGRLIKRFVRGAGPGELQYFATGMSAIRDTLYAGNGSNGINVYGPDLQFIRVLRPPSIHSGALVPVAEGFAVASQKYETRRSVVGIHVIRRSGDLVRSFVRDSILDPRRGPPSYNLSAASDGALWVAAPERHVIEKWSTEGKRLATLGSVPAWFDTTRAYADGRFYVVGTVERDGVLWVMSAVPAPNYRSIIAEAVRGRGNEVDGRLIPEHKLFSARLEAYDVASGKLIADRTIDSHFVALLGGGTFMTYSEGSDDQPRLDVWDMRLRR